MGNNNELFWSSNIGEDDIIQIKELLKTIYDQVLRKLESEKEKLESISKILLEEQEIEGKELLRQFY